MSASSEPFDAPLLVDEEEHLRRVAAAASGARRLGLDVEASGMHAYRARPCALQLAWDAGRSVAVVDPARVALGPTRRDPRRRRPGQDCPRRRLRRAHSRRESGSCSATSTTRRSRRGCWARTATGLAALLESELGVRIGKTLQQHDWRMRPLDDAHARRTSATTCGTSRRSTTSSGARSAERGIEDAVLEETRVPLRPVRRRRRRAAHRSRRTAGQGRRASSRSASSRSLRAIVVAARSARPQRRDVPPHRVASAPKRCWPRAGTRPTTAAAVARVRGIAGATPEGHAFVESARASARPPAPRQLPDDERARLRARANAGGDGARSDASARRASWRGGGKRRSGAGSTSRWSSRATA